MRRIKRPCGCSLDTQAWMHLVARGHANPLLKVADGDNMTYDSGSFRQFAGRDAGIAASGMDCF